MRIKGIITYITVAGFIGLLSLSNCEECEECGPSLKETYVNFKFINIDSLVKINIFLVELQDTITKVEDEIANGNEALIPKKDSLNNVYDYYLRVSSSIKNGKIKIDEVYGINGEGPIFFSDSAANDSLVTFKFPLDMNANSSSFIIHIHERADTIELNYLTRNTLDDFSVLVEAIDLQVVTHTFDSIKVNCSLDSCTSEQTSIYAYF